MQLHVDRKLYSLDNSWKFGHSCMINYVWFKIFIAVKNVSEKKNYPVLKISQHWPLNHLRTQTCVYLQEAFYFSFSTHQDTKWYWHLNVVWNSIAFIYDHYGVHFLAYAQSTNRWHNFCYLIFQRSGGRQVWQGLATWSLCYAYSVQW